AVTHDPNFEQRRVPVDFTREGDSLRITLPGTPNLAPPGDYMLFLLRNASGRAVPSIARWIRLGGAPVLSARPPATAPFAFDRPTPNPARGSVRFRFALPGPARIALTLEDVAGRRVRSIAFDAAAGGH